MSKLEMDKEMFISDEKMDKLPEVFTLRFHRDDLLDLIQLLRFSKAASNLLVNEELSKGSIKGAAKMKEYSEVANFFIGNLLINIDMGEPPNKTEN